MRFPVFLIAMLLAVLSYAQSPSKILRFVNSSAPFGENLPTGVILVDVSTGKSYLTLGPLASTKTIATCSGTELKETGNTTHTGDVTGSSALTIAGSAVTTSKIADGNVTVTKLGTSGVSDAEKVYTTDAAGVPQLTSTQPMTGDVTVNSSGVATIAANAVTYDKLQTTGTAGKILGSSASSTAVTELDLGSGLSLTGTTLNTTSGGGTVTSVGMSLPSVFSVSGTPVTGAGTLTATLASQAANTVLASPDGSTGTPAFRSLLSSDIPLLDWVKIATGKPTTLSGYGITDGMSTSHVANGITATDITNWNSIAASQWTTNGSNIHYSTGNVGVGVAAPAARLEVAGTGATNATTALMVRNSGGTANMAVLDNGYVGIGTANPATALDVYGAITTRSTTGAGYVYISGTGTSANYSVLNLDNAQTGTSLKRWQVAHRVESPINRLAFFHYDGTGWYENMSILPSGVVAMPFQSRAKAYPSQTADQSIPNNSYTVLALSTEEFDAQAEYNTSTYAFVAKTAGYYQVNANVTWGGTTAPGNFIVFITKNGGSLATFERYRPIENAWFAESISNICYLNVGDSVQLMVWQNSGSANSIIRNIDRTYLSIHKLS